MGATFIHDSCTSVFDTLKSLDELYIQLCKKSLARLLQGKNFENDNQSQKERKHSEECSSDIGKYGKFRIKKAF
jgi:hypothetical protein